MPLKALSEADLDINKYTLDDEAAQQPRKMRIWTRTLAEAKKATRDAKKALALVTAQQRDKIRDAPAKLTEKGIEDALVQTQAYSKALDAYNLTQFEEDVYDGYVKSLQSRDYNISNLTKLYGLGVFQITGANPEMRERAKLERATAETNTRAAEPSNKPPKP